MEAAIAAEQQSIPEESDAAPAAGRPLAEWQEVEAAEQRLQKKLGKFRLDMYVMEGDGNCQGRLQERLRIFWLDMYVMEGDGNCQVRLLLAGWLAG